MKRFLTMTLVIVAFLGVAGTAARAASHQRPSFLFIIADDQSPFDLQISIPIHGSRHRLLISSQSKEWFLTERIMWDRGREPSVRPRVT